MTRKTTVASLLAGATLIVLVWWLGASTRWTEVKIPIPLKGEALVNPFYAAQRFAEALGARAAWERALAIPPPDSVIVLSGWNWNLTARRREALERWVEAGGRLVVDASIADGEFERWSGIARDYEEADPDDLDLEEPDLEEQDADAAPGDPCQTLREQNGARTGVASTSYSLCYVDAGSFLTSKRAAVWALLGDAGIQALRVQIGRGSVTAVNARPFRYRSLFDGDHARIFVAATGLRRGDDVHFLSEEDHPSLIALMWQHGAPVVLLLLAWLGLVLWRGAVRFGPAAALPPAARRSLAEQITGTGQFALRHGSGESLHAACVRALDEAARRRIGGYATLPASAAAAALARLTGFDRHVILTAVYHPRLRRPGELRGTLSLLETARRRMLTCRTRTSHGSS